jgi:hypothetical protein
MLLTWSTSHSIGKASYHYCRDSAEDLKQEETKYKEREQFGF